MAKKEFFYRGKTLEELQVMSMKELSELLPAAARRKLNRGLTEQEKIFMKNLRTSNKPVKTHSRTMIILPEMVGKTIKVYTGKVFDDLTIYPEMIGHRFGEFALSKKRVSHSNPGVGATKSSSNVSVK